MRTVFADTFYWIALASPKDEWHDAAKAAGVNLNNPRIVTTDEILVEFLTFFSGKGDFWREKAVQLVRTIAANPNVSVVPQTRDSFNRGLELYAKRLDREYSLTDCISMVTMRQHQLTEVLTQDHHFEQEGFIVLLTDKGL